MKVFFLAALLGTSGIGTAQVTDQDLRKGPGENWLTYIGDYAGHRYSPLNQINRSNVAQLSPKWVRHIDTQADLESTPLVYRGVMYVTNSNEVYALDAVTGREVWRYAATGVRRRGVNRGAAMFGDSIYFETSDCHLIALRRANGGFLWDRDFAGADRAYSCTGAPLIVKEKVIVGVASSGKACFIAALSANTGEEIWRFRTVPKQGEPGSDTWGTLPLDWGSAPTWTTGTWDPDLNILYWATGNPWPDFGGDRPGDNLYSDCVLALDPDNGTLKWYFQFVPHDTHDWDANETPVLLNADFGGRARKLLLQANRDGFYYVIDRTSGEFLLAEPFVRKLNWAKGVDSKGRPIVAPNMDPSSGGVRVCPSVHGATNYWAPSVNLELGLFYVVSLEECEIYYSSAQKPIPNNGFRGTGHTSIPSEPGEFFLRALDIKTGKLRWEYPMPGPTTMWAGTAATAGGLVFTADDGGDLVALNAETGADLWHFYMGSNLKASPMAFAVDSQEYITIAAGSNIFTFGLPAQ